jgi:hypothetical protein
MSKSLATIALAITVSACAHLDQAPLVYASRTALGVDVSAGAPDSPGLSMSVGYKQVDAAYVPVAVARSCAPADSEHCSDASYALQVIGGSSQNGNSPGSRDATEEAAMAEANAFAELYQQSVEAATQAQQQQRAASLGVDALRVQVEPLTARRRQFEQRSGELADLNTRANALKATPTPGDEVELAQIEAKIKEIEGLQLTPVEQATILSLDKQLDAANSELAKANADLSAKQAEVGRRRAELAQKRDAINQLNRNDSYSVFGSFEDKTEAGSADAKVGIGKVFATGVASQNISDGLATMYRQRDVTACYEAVAKSAITDAAALDKLLQGCRRK